MLHDLTMVVWKQAKQEYPQWIRRLAVALKVIKVGKDFGKLGAPSLALYAFRYLPHVSWF